MNANELMIGDWVLFSGELKQVTSIHISDNRLEQIYVFGKTCQVSTINDYIEPIPITPEILEKNRFEYNQKETERMQDILGDNIMLFNFPLGNGFYIEWNPEKNIGMITDHGFIKFKYVHELQHVLKMCGIIHEIII